MNSPCIVVPLVEILKRCLQYNVCLCLGPLGVCKMDLANLDSVKRGSISICVFRIREHKS